MRINSLSRLCVIAAIWLLSQITMANSLSKIQQEIKQQQSKIAEQKKKREHFQSILKSQEIEMGNVSTHLKKTETALLEIQREMRNTVQEIKRLEKLEIQQKAQLKIQLESAYRSGINPSILERLLSESAKEAGRMAVYYDHINQIRIDAIYELRVTQEELKTRRNELQEQQKGQQNRLSEQKKQEKALLKVKNEREKTIQALDKILTKEQGRLEALKANEIALRNKLNQAQNESEKEEKQREQQAIADIEKRRNRKSTEQEKQQARRDARAGNGLGNAKYPMPVNGKVIHRYGSSLMGELKWSGIVVESPAGIAVKSIAGGRVILAGWLEGYGQVVVIDHGDGDMSLYGYNQSLLVRKGDKVVQGQSIATVGNSGGQSRFALYFEIRRKGVPVNPMRWLQ